MSTTKVKEPFASILPYCSGKSLQTNCTFTPAQPATKLFYLFVLRSAGESFCL